MPETASPHHVLPTTLPRTQTIEGNGPGAVLGELDNFNTGEMTSHPNGALQSSTTTNGHDKKPRTTTAAAAAAMTTMTTTTTTTTTTVTTKIATQSKSNGHARAGNGKDAIGTRTNGHVAQGEEDQEANEDGERPAKRQRTRQSTPPPPTTTARKPKPISPPWKKISADGPTTFLENGRRKSGRINSIPFELQAPDQKRTARHASNATDASINASKKNDASANGRSSRMPANTHKKRVAPRAAPEPASKSSSKKAAAAAAAAESRSSRSLRRRTPSPPPQPTRHSTRSRRARFADDADRNQDASPVTKLGRESRDATGRSPRIRLKVPPRSNVIPLVHPGQVRKRPRIAKDFEDFWQRSGDIAVEEGGLLAVEDGPPYTDEMAQRDARAVLRIEQEAEPGGLLSFERCSLFIPESEEEPPRQWARQDHLIKAMGNLRKLMLMEQQRHKFVARRLAEACREEWLRRQPKSAEELEAEEREHWAVRFRTVIRALTVTWDNVRIEVNRQRLERWEAEEQKRVKAALNQAVSLSEQKLQARQAGGLDSGMVSADEDFDILSDIADEEDLVDGDSASTSDDSEQSDDDDDDDDDDDRSDIMSSSDEEEDEEEDDKPDLTHLADEDLTQEQLRAKYADIPKLDFTQDEESTTDPTEPTPAESIAAEDETSDESIDMDDDLGSSDMEDSDASDDEDSGSTQSGSEDQEEEEEDEEENGLLGLLFGKSELKAMKKSEPSLQNGPTAQKDVEMVDVTQEIVTLNGTTGTESSPAIVDEPVDDDDAISLVHHPDSTCASERSGDEDEDDRGALKAGVGAESAINGVLSDRGTTAADDDMGDASALSSRELSAIDKLATAEEDKKTTTQTPELLQDGLSLHEESSPIQVKEKEDLSLITKSHVRGSKSVTVEPSPAPPTHKIEVPFLLRGTLREYQRQGLDWLAGLYANNTNGILADEMGLGKTIQTIALLAHLACQHEVWGPHLVIVPTSVMLNWEMEFKKWCPGFKILAYYGSQEERKRKRQGWNNDDIWNVCITSYQLVLQDQQVFRRRRWHYMILDEAHNIKNFKSQRWQTLLGFNTHSRLLLTGTPLQNNLTELWSLLFFLMPAENGVGGFADLQEFHDWFRKPESQILENGREQMDEEARAIIGKLHKVLRPYLLRRLKADVEKQMPAKYEHVEFCRLSKRQRELYDGFLARSDTRDTLASSNYLSIINCLMQLRKVCNHPDLFVDRPIMTSFRMQKSVPVGYEDVERVVRRTLLASNAMSIVNLGFLNLVPTQHEHLSTLKADSIARLSSHRMLMDLREAQKSRAQNAYTNLDPSTVGSNIAYLESAARWERFEELQHCVYLNALRRQQRPIYGENVINLLTIEAHKRTSKPRVKVPQKIMDWFESDTDFLRAVRPSLNQRADSLKTTIEKFSCVTPTVVTRDLDRIILGRKSVEAFTDEDLKLSAPKRWAPFLPKEAPPDPWHEARMRLTIQFPDKRLLQYDCGKLQALDKLLRRLQAGGHRALIFTQMTKVLDILEQFLNIHGHKYLRLDGATKVEQRQILTDRFNNDTRILCFILSTRSGGLGINLTGADTVIFYDQDWNPAMDKQCQDRCHRIGQTRDVHIYRLVSEHTIEANILRKASQKQMLDDVVIQEGEFTTDSFNKMSVRDVLGEKADFMREGIAAADAALDLVLGGSEGSSARRGRAFEQAEDKEDVDAARVAEKEIQADDADFTEKTGLASAASASTTRQGTPAGRSVLDGGIGILDEPDVVQAGELEASINAWGSKMGTVDDYMISAMMEQLKHTKLELPKDKKKGKKKGKDTRKR